MLLADFFSRFTGRPHRTAAPPRPPDGSRIYAFGDVHGRVDLLKRLLDAIVEDTAQSARSWDRCEVIGLGDYLDRGPDSRGVLDLLIANRPAETCTMTFLKGNHEDAFLTALADAGALPSWLDFGGAATLVSYGVQPIAGTPTPERAERMRAGLAASVPGPHLDLLRSMPPSLRLGDFFFVHAGVRPGRALDRQDTQDLLWIRQEFLVSRRYHGAVVVHGHHMVREPEILGNRMGLDTGAYCTGILTCLVLEGAQSWILQATPEGIRRTALPPR